MRSLQKGAVSCFKAHLTLVHCQLHLRKEKGGKKGEVEKILVGSTSF